MYFLYFFPFILRYSQYTQPFLWKWTAAVVISFRHRFVTLSCWVMLPLHASQHNWLLCKCSSGSEPWGCSDKCISINHMFSTSLPPFPSVSHSYSMLPHANTLLSMTLCAHASHTTFESERVFSHACVDMWRREVFPKTYSFQANPRWTENANKIMSASLLSGAEVWTAFLR